MNCRKLIIIYVNIHIGVLVIVSGRSSAVGHNIIYVRNWVWLNNEAFWTNIEALWANNQVLWANIEALYVNTEEYWADTRAF